MRVAIVGLGTAGAASALFLSRAGHAVTLFERVPEPGPAGAGIMMQPSGLLVLERLGCAGPILERGSRVDSLVATTTSGRRVLDLRYAELAPELYGLGLHRGVLFETLFGAVAASAVDLRLGVEARALAGGGILDARGRAHGPFELVLLCDGARSHVRDALAALAKVVRPYPWRALWFIGSRDAPAVRASRDDPRDGRNEDRLALGLARDADALVALTTSRARSYLQVAGSTTVHLPLKQSAGGVQKGPLVASHAAPSAAAAAHVPWSVFWSMFMHAPRTPAPAPPPVHAVRSPVVES